MMSFCKAWLHTGLLSARFALAARRETVADNIDIERAINKILYNCIEKLKGKVVKRRKDEVFTAFCISGLCHLS